MEPFLNLTELNTDTDPDTLSAMIEANTLAVEMNNHANQAEEVGQVDEAIALHREALALKIRAFSEASVQAGISFNGLGEAGRLPEAEEVLLKALKVREEKSHGGLGMGPRLDAAATRDNLARLREAQGNFEDARTIRMTGDRKHEVLCGNYHAGSEDHVCDRCKPLVDSYSNAFGANSLGRQARPSQPNATVPLLEALMNANACWNCGWLASIVLASIVMSTWPQTPAENIISPASHLTTQVSFGWHSITMTDKSSAKVENAPQINRIAFSYGAADTDSDKKKRVVYSKCEKEPRNIRSVLDQSESLNWSAPDELYAGRIRPAEIDHRLLRRWKECCMKDHGGTCDQTFMTHRVRSLRFVDVVERRIVEHSPDGITWVALSYCWGGPQDHALQTKNLHLYQQPGSLTDDVLPQGISDAMTLTRALGERYIWVDSLCIVQDDDKDKLVFIAAMGTIYAHAMVTIINAANTHVAHAVPGVSGPRRPQQVHRMKDFWLVEALDLPHQSWQGYLHDTMWNSRGWTFQEGLLSPRCLIIGKDQVYWQCKTASWCEDSFWEDSSQKNSLYRHYSGSNMLRRLTDSTEEDWMELYKDVLNAYTKRELTSEGDRLGAVEAILEVLRRSDEEGYFWGMPKGHMELALSWVSSPRNTRRECDAKLMGPDDQVVSSPFPSWSWVGWHGPSPMPTMNRALLGGRLGLKFYSIQRDGTPLVLDENPFIGPERDFSKKEYMEYSDLHEQIGYPRGLPHSSIHYEDRTVSAGDIPQEILSSRHCPSILAFWTSTAILDMKYEGYNGYHHCSRIDLSHGDVHFCSAWERNENFKPSGKGKFIVVGTERIRMSHGGDVTVNLLLVDQDELGISYRHKLVTYTPESTWERLENRKWELIFLA